MLKEHVLSLAAKTLSEIHQAKERIKNSLHSEAVGHYVRHLKDAAIHVIQTRWLREPQSANPAPHNRSHAPVKTLKTSVKPRKSSIKPAKEISSPKAGVILQAFKSGGCRCVKKSDAIDGKTSLAYLVWALGHAEQANIKEGISVHDVSAFLYRATGIEIYPINISRVVYGNAALIRKAGQENRTKTYLLTADGQEIFKQKFL